MTRIMPSLSHSLLSRSFNILKTSQHPVKNDEKCGPVAVRKVKENSRVLRYKNNQLYSSNLTVPRYVLVHDKPYNVRRRHQTVKHLRFKERRKLQSNLRSTRRYCLRSFPSRSLLISAEEHSNGVAINVVRSKRIENPPGSIFSRECIMCDKQRETMYFLRYAINGDSRGILHASYNRRNIINTPSTNKGKMPREICSGPDSAKHTEDIVISKENKEPDLIKTLKENENATALCGEESRRDAKARNIVAKSKYSERLFRKLLPSIIDNIYSGFVILGLLAVSNAQVNCPTMQVLETGGITCDVIKEIINTHNDLRQSVAEGSVDNQPAASNMRQLYWDDELARGAQDWANQCTFAHNDAKDREVARFQVGQNLAMTKTKKARDGSTKEFARHIHNWFQEHTMYHFEAIRSIEDLQSTGHYTQVAWANTYLVGCGYSRYRTRQNIMYRLYVCHYGPSGNQINETPYKNGSDLSCPQFSKPSMKYPNLCGLKKPPRDPCESGSKRRPFRLPNLLNLGNRRFLTPEKHEDPSGTFTEETNNEPHPQQRGNPLSSKECTKYKPVPRTTIFYSIISFIL